MSTSESRRMLGRNRIPMSGLLVCAALWALISQGASAQSNPNSETVQYSYNSQNRLATVTHSDSTTRTYVYENSNFPNALTGVIDENNTRYSTWGFDTQGRATSSTEAGGADSVTLVYNADSSVTTTDALGAVRTFTFGRSGDRNLVTGISGSQCPTCQESAATTYDSAGWVASRTDYNGNLTCYANDPTRGVELVRIEGFAPGSICPTNLSAYTPASGTLQRKITTQWSTNFREPASIAEPNRTTAFTFDLLGNVLTKTITDTSVTPNVSRTWTYTYFNSGLFGQLQTATGPRTDITTDVTTYAYNACTSSGGCGEVQSITDAAGHVTTFVSYSGLGQPLTKTDPNGVPTTLTYDARQRLTSSKVATEATSYAFYPTGLLQRVTLPDSSSIQFTYDGAQRVTQITDGAGSSVQYTLDSTGNRTAESAYDPSNTLSRTLSRKYNALNELSQVIGAAGNAAVTTTLGYDNQGNLTSSNEPLSRNIGNQYDALNRLTQITDPAGGIIQFAFDANDNLAGVVDPRSLATSYAHNGFGDLTRQVSPDTGTAINTYDSGGNLQTATDARGAVATLGYDALNRLTSVAYTIGGTTDQTISLFYDSGTNGKGRLTGAADDNHSMSWSYDSLGRVTNKSQTINAPPGPSPITYSVGYAYTNGNLTSISIPGFGPVVYSYNSNHQVTGVTLNGATVISNVLYEPFGPVRGWTWGNGTTEVRLHNTDGNPSLLTGIESVSIGYDNAFRIQSITNSTNNALSWAYGYDSLDRLTSASKSSSTLDWTYDANGNRLQQTGAPASGALTPGGTSFTLNARGRMSSAIAGGTTTHYFYNPLGQLIYKNTGGTATQLLYDEASHLLAEVDGGGSLIQETIWLGDIPIATVRPNGGIYYVHADQINTPRMVTRPSDNAIMWRWDADPFGTTTPNPNPTGQGIFVYNLRLPGQYYLPETGLFYNGNRTYDPATGRYIESDPIGLAGGSYSTYSYTNNNPIGRSDPSGLQTAPTLPIGPGPLIIPPVAIPGTPENQQFVNAAIGAIEEIQAAARRAAQAIRNACSSEQDEDKNCEALYQSTLATCASLRGRKRFACFEAARENREQCYREKGKTAPTLRVKDD
jgi:RHS repeat-associated protein